MRLQDPDSHRRPIWLLAAVGVIAFTMTSPTFSQDKPNPEPALSNKVKWSTASELDNFGFDVYRAERPSGPFEKINEDIILGAGTSDTPREYVYEDRTIRPDTAYFYYVVSISMDGKRERFTPTVAAPPKPATSGVEEEEKSEQED